MKCNECRKLMEYYSENKIDPLADKNLSMHVDGCPGCKKELEFYEMYFSVLNKNKQMNLPRGFISGVNRKIDEMESKGKLSRLMEFFINKFNDFRKYRIPFEAAGVLATVLIFIVIFKPFQNADMGLQDSKTPSVPVTDENTVIFKEEDSVTKIEQNDNEPAIAAEKPDDDKLLKKNERSSAADTDRNKNNKVQKDSGETLKKEEILASISDQKADDVKQNSDLQEIPEPVEQKKKSVSSSGAGVPVKEYGISSTENYSVKSEYEPEDIGAYEVIIAEKEDRNKQETEKVRNTENAKSAVKMETARKKSVSPDVTVSENSVIDKSGESDKTDSGTAYSATVNDARTLIIKNKGKIVAESFNSEKGMTDTFLVEIRQSDYLKLIRDLQRSQNVQKLPVIREDSNELIKVWIKIK